MVGAIFAGTRLPGPEVFSKNQKIVDINVEKWTEKVTVVKVVQAQVPWGPKEGFVIEPLKQ